MGRSQNRSAPPKNDVRLLATEIPASRTQMSTGDGSSLAPGRKRPAMKTLNLRATRRELFCKGNHEKYQRSRLALCRVRKD